MYPVNPFNPYQGVNPAYLQQQAPRPMQTHTVKVNGRAGAEAYVMAPDSDIILLDETQPVIWFKQTDGAGYPTLTAYDITPHQDRPAVDLRNIEQRISNLERIMNNEPDNTSNARKVINE